LQDVFEASQDVMDQLGRASAIQHYSRRLLAIKGANLSGTEFQSPLLKLPLQEGWLFGEEIATITETCKAQRTMTSLMSSAKNKPKQVSYKKPHSGGNQQRSSSATTSKNTGGQAYQSFKAPRGGFSKGRGGKGQYSGRSYNSGRQNQHANHYTGSQPSKNP
jgi:hypothetical protein